MSGRRDFGAAARSAAWDAEITENARKLIGDTLAPSTRLKTHAKNQAAELRLEVDFQRVVEGNTIAQEDVVTWYAVLRTGRGDYRERVIPPKTHEPGTIDAAWTTAFRKIGVELGPPWRNVER